MTTALVTGATSYPGRSLVGALIDGGHEVHAVVRPGSDLARFDPLPRRPRLHVHDGGTDSMIDIVGDAAPDVIFHFATFYAREHAPADIEPMVRANVTFGIQVLEAVRRAGVRKFVNAASAFQYFDSEDYRPLNLYAATKRAFEDVLAYYVDASGLAAVTLVLFDVYGPDDWRRRLMAAIRDAQRSGEPLPLVAPSVTLDLVFIADVVAAFLHAARLLEDRPADVSGRVFAIGSGRPRTIDEVISLFERVGGAAVVRDWGRIPMPERTITRPWPGEPLPDWRPRVPLEEGIRRFLDG